MTGAKSSEVALYTV